MEEDGGGQLFQKMRGEEVAKGTSYKEFIQPVPFAHVRALDQEQDCPLVTLPAPSPAFLTVVCGLLH